MKKCFFPSFTFHLLDRTIQWPTEILLFGVFLNWIISAVASYFENCYVGITVSLMRYQGSGSCYLMFSLNILNQHFFEYQFKKALIFVFTDTPETVSYKLVCTFAIYVGVQCDVFDLEIMSGSDLAVISICFYNWYLQLNASDLPLAVPLPAMLSAFLYYITCN